MADKTRERAIGDRGEGAACELLKKKGCRILETNYSFSGGEIDIIARQGEYIIFAEVKTREASAFGTPSLWVDVRKQRKIIKAARVYMEQNDLTLQPRFDIIEIVYDRRSGMIVSADHTAGAFFQEDGYAAF